jgi:hypothetical protein
MRTPGNQVHPRFSSNQPPPHSVSRMPLSIPKNVVLVSLMEAAQRQMLDLKHQDRGRQESDDEGNNCREGGKGDSPRGMDVVVAVVVVDDDDDDDDSFTGSTSDHEEDDDEEFELDRIFSGMSVFPASCGTYAVTADGAVVVQPNNPRASPRRMKRPGHETLSGNHSTSSLWPTDSGEEHIGEPLVAEMPTIKSGGSEGYSTEQCLSITSTDSPSAQGNNRQQRHSNDRAASREPFVLHKGQTLQVVSLEDKVAKLARNKGYIVLGSSSHLVKGTQACIG